MTFSWTISPIDGIPCDFRKFLLPNDAGIDRKAFSALPGARKNAGLSDVERSAFVRALAIEIRAEDRQTTSCRHGVAIVERFFQWVSTNDRVISHATVSAHLRDFRGCIADERYAWLWTNWLIRRAATLLGRDHKSLLLEMFGPASSDWIIHLSKGKPALLDFRALTTPGGTAMGRSEFYRQSDRFKNAAINIGARSAFARDIANAVVGAQRRARESHRDLTPLYVTAAWTLFRWMDEHNLNVTRATVFKSLPDAVTELHSRCIDGGRQVLHMLYWLDLTAVERELLDGIPTRRNAQQPRGPNNPWAIAVSKGHPLDFRLFIRPGDAQKGRKWLTGLPENKRQALVLNSDARTQMMRKACACIQAAHVQEASASTLISRYNEFHRFIIWCDTEKLPVSLNSLLDNLPLYSMYVSNRVRSSAIKGATGRSINAALARTASELLDTSSSYVAGHLTKIRKEHPAGRQGHYVGAEERRTFVRFLESIIGGISIESVHRDQQSGLLISHNGATTKVGGYEDRWAGRAPALLLNVLIVRLRIAAELLCFIAATGANLSVAAELRRSNLDWSLDRGGYRLRIFKERKGGIVTIRMPKRYRPALERHIDFISALDDYLTPEAAQLVFLNISAESPSNLAGQTLRRVDPGFRKSPDIDSLLYVLREVCASLGIRYLGPKQLRSSRGDYLYTAYDGDSLKTSRALGNTPSVARQSYGGYGNLPKAQREMTAFWAWHEEVHASVAPGGCARPAQPRPIDGEPTPVCGAENACFACENYRGINNLDFISLILSRAEELKIRTRSEPARADEFMILVDYIESIVASYCDLNPHHSAEVSSLRTRISDGELHPSLKQHVTIYRRLHDSFLPKA